MTDAPKDAPDRYDPKNLLEDVTAEELLQLDGKVFPIFDTFAHTVKRIDETTIVLDKDSNRAEIKIDPGTGNLYLSSKIAGGNRVLINAVTSAVNLMRRGLSTDLETRWNHDCGDEWEDYGKEISKTFDRVMDWLRKEVIRAMNETNSGQGDLHSVKISFNDSDISARTMEDLIRTSKKY